MVLIVKIVYVPIDRSKLFIQINRFIQINSLIFRIPTQ